MTKATEAEKRAHQLRKSRERYDRYAINQKLKGRVKRSPFWTDIEYEAAKAVVLAMRADLVSIDEVRKWLKTASV